MPLYQQIIVALPKYSKQNLSELFKNYSLTILNHGGVVRGIEHHGIRMLPEQAKRLEIFIELLIEYFICLLLYSL